MIRTEFDGKGIAIRFYRPDPDLTICDLRIGEIGQNPKEMLFKFEGIAKRNVIDQFDKGRGHLLSLERALKQLSVEYSATRHLKDLRRACYQAYSQWAQKNNLRTSIPLERVGV